MRNKQQKDPHGDAKKRNFETAQEDYRFIRETIKDQSTGGGRMLTRITALVSVCFLLGICAVAAVLAKEPDFAIGASAHSVQAIQIPKDEPNAAVCKSDGEKGAVQSEAGISGEGMSSLENYATISEELSDIVKEPKRAMVTVTGERQKGNILDGSNLETGKSYGLVFLKQKDGLYILTNTLATEDAEYLRVTFYEGSAAEGTLKASDSRTGLTVVHVAADAVEEEVLEKIAVAELGNSYDVKQSQPVIALGSPAGYPDSVILGRVTSASGKMAVRDGAYDLIVTDISGSEEGQGILLNLDGQVVGILAQRYVPYAHAASLVKAMAISPLKPLIERLANGNDVVQAGIYGQDLPEKMEKKLGISGGVYVDRVAGNSPAMKSGIQSGDIITYIEGEAVEDYEEYARLLQTCTSGQELTWKLLRKGGEDAYEEIELKITVWTDEKK